MLKVEDIHVFYGLFEAIKGVTMSVKEGETVGIIGPNGHGKSTILKAISGVNPPRKGEMTFRNKRIDNLKPQEIVNMGIIQVPEGGRLFPEMSVMENLLLGAYAGEAWKRKEANLETVFQLFPNLKGRENQKCNTLSGGERMAVSIGRGLMAAANLLMLDEPSLGLSPKLAQEVLRKIDEIKETGLSMILVEQSTRYVSEVADRIYLIENGRVELEGSRDEVLENKHVKESYLGVM